MENNQKELRDLVNSVKKFLKLEEKTLDKITREKFEEDIQKAELKRKSDFKKKMSNVEVRNEIILEMAMDILNDNSYNEELEILEIDYKTMYENLISLVGKFKNDLKELTIS